MSNTPPIPGQQSAGDKAGSSPPDVNVAPKSTAGNDNPPSKIFPVRAGQVGGGEPSGSRLYKSVAAGRSAGGEPSGSRPDTGFAASDDVSDHDSDIEIITDRPLLSQTLDDLMSGKQSRDKGKGRAFEGPPRPSEGPQRPHDPVARQEALAYRQGRMGLNENEPAANRAQIAPGPNIDVVRNMELGHTTQLVTGEGPEEEILTREIQVPALEASKGTTGWTRALIKNDQLREIVKKIAPNGPFPIQSGTLANTKAGLSTIMCAPFATGKTLAYLLSIVDKILEKKFNFQPGSSTETLAICAPQALVIVPTRELAIQISNVATHICEKLGIKVGLVHGGPPPKLQNAAMERAHLLIATPGRLIDSCRRGFIYFDYLRILVLDEASMLLRMSFRDQIAYFVDPQLGRLSHSSIQYISIVCTQQGNKELIDRIMSDVIRGDRFILANCGTASMQAIFHRLTFHQVGEDLTTRVEAVTELLKDTLEQGPMSTIIYTASYDRSEALYASLKALVPESVLGNLNGHMPQSEREAVMTRFLGGQCSIMIATTGCGAVGLNYPLQPLVVVMDIPRNTLGSTAWEAWTMEASRTGRLGHQGHCITFFDGESSKDIQLAAHLHAYLVSKNLDAPQFLSECAERVESEHI